jgi:hypothetical protein
MEKITKEVKLPGGDNCLTKKHLKNVKDSKINNRFELKITSQIFPSQIISCVSHQSKILQKIEGVLNKWMSYHNIFNTLLQFERFKNSYFYAEQLKFFNNFRSYKLEKLLSKEELPEMTLDEIEKFILNYQDDYFIKRILEY